MKAIKARKIYTYGEKYINNGIILEDKGKIIEIGTDIEISGDIEVVDYSDKVIMPGLIDGHTHVGVWGDGEDGGGFDGNEMSRVVAGDVHIIDSINIRQKSYQTALEGGVTCVQILPGSSNAIGGTACVSKTHGSCLESMIINKDSGLKGATGENVKRRHGLLNNHGTATRMGVASKIREYFTDSKKYMEKVDLACEKGETYEKELLYEAGVKVLKGEMPFRVHAHRHDDISTVIRICNEFNIDYSIEHCTEGHLIKELVGGEKATVMLGPGLSSSFKVESANYSDSNPKILSEAGAKVSLITDHPFLSLRYFIHYAGIVHREGLSFDETLKSITINPAIALGVSHLVGSLEKGKDCDLIVLGGEPFTIEGRIENTIVNGESVWAR